MSYDAAIVMWTGKSWAKVEEVGSMTTNVRAMYELALDPYRDVHGLVHGGRYGGTRECTAASGLAAVSGYAAPVAEPWLRWGLALMDDNDVTFRAMQHPEGRPGSFEDARTYLRACAEACGRHPLGTFAVWW